MITTLQDDNGWKFLFLAANQDAFAEGGKLGVRMSNAVSYSASGAGVTNVFQAVSSNVGSYRKSKMDLYKSGSMDFMERSVDSLGFTDTQRKDSMDKNPGIIPPAIQNKVEELKKEDKKD